MNKTSLVSLIAIVIIVGGSFLFFKSPVLAPNPNPTPIACTMEAKLCPDGSYVGRSGPNCEFALCPDTQKKEETTASLNQKILNGGVYIIPLQVVSDSRCPYGVDCFWAGEISIKVKLEKGGVSKEVVMKERGTALFEGSNVSLVGVIPENKTKIPTPEKDYQFIFKVVGVSNTGTVSGTVTLSPVCPVERIPPDPNCAPKFYSTLINIMKDGSTSRIKTIQTDIKGVFSVDLDPGSYVFQAQGGNVLPRCSDVTVKVKSGQYTTTEISCDTGIR